MPKSRQTKEQLRWKIKELESQLAHAYHFADAQIERAGERLLAGGVVLQLNELGGKEIFSPVCIRDGLSKETINCIRADLRRSYELATQFKPKGID